MVDGEGGRENLSGLRSGERAGRKDEPELNLFETLVDEASDAFYIVDPETGEFLDVNDTACEMLGYERSELLEMGVWDISCLVDSPDAFEEQYGLGRVTDGTVETEHVRADGSQFPVELTYSTVEVGGKSYRVTTARDISQRKEYERKLEKLSAVADEFFELHSLADVGERFIEISGDMLGFECAAVYRYDDRKGVLHPLASGPKSGVDEVVGDPPVFEAGEGIAWDVFVDGESVRFDDVRTDDAVYNPDTQVRSELLVPLGEHGVVILGDTERGTFDERSVTLVEILASMVEAAFDRVTHRQQIEERERKLERRSQEIEILELIRDGGREISRVFAHPTSGEEIEQTACQQLLNIRDVSLVWIGKTVLDGDGLEPRTVAGDESGYLQSGWLNADDSSENEPSLNALTRGEPVIVHNIGEGLSRSQWRKDALRRGFQSVIGLPIVYQNNTRGVLSVYATKKDAFDESLRTILASLCDFLAHADAATERTQALLAEMTTELEFEIRDVSCFFLRAAEQLTTTLELDTIEPEPDGRWRVHVLIDGSIRDECLAMAEQAPEVETVRCTTKDGGVICELCFSEPFIVSKLANHGVVVREITARNESCRVTVGVPSNIPPSTVTDVVSTLYPESRLLAKRKQSNSPDAAENVQHEALEQLTPRQWEVLREAYRNGYFERPKGTPGTEIAEQMDISSTAFHEHLRAAESKIVDIVMQTGEGDVLDKGDRTERA